MEVTFSGPENMEHMEDILDTRIHQPLQYAPHDNQKIPNPNRGQWTDDPEIGLTLMAGKGQMIPKTESRWTLPCGRASKLRQEQVHNIPLVMMSDHWQN